MTQTITSEIKKLAQEKIQSMPLGAYTRLKINGQISDIVISTVSSGVYFYNVPGTIGRNISEQVIAFVPYNQL
jgi:dihydrodipicolinate synthase/N-acetylneuraminate lyase